MSAVTGHRGYLLDTSVISILAPGREPRWPVGMSNWLQARSDLLFLPGVAIAELTQGICKLRRAGGVERAARLAVWLDGLVEGYGDRILPIDAAVARLAGGMSEAAMAKGRHPGFADVAIAATARHAGLLLLTCNLRHFEPLEVACADPTVGLPD
ncbi:MAG: PIN domain-containing protein [Gammaproteobacteria bacterium]|nr:PIN domain-containing protein [Gammaproteobacteria bacterium]MBU1443149.1 PIN domain-containing protein [Gammaproteobacteria bacterium]MBU2285910.1 PIN domain-containing protein [Gammaproteobacteria bacterium]MBU2411010.1 PIN domain-containing protein [Gammaproteobacteria bacterium]